MQPTATPYIWKPWKDANSSNWILLSSKVEHLPSRAQQDTAVNRYISYKAEGKDGAAIDFFLENGKIIINLSQENNSATGTANNDAYQEIRAQINGLNKQMMSIYESMSDTTLTDEQR